MYRCIGIVVLFWYRGVWVSLILLFIPPVLVSVLITLQILKGVKVLSFSQLPSSCDFSMLTRQVPVPLLAYALLMLS